jgi:Got1/Sft2-like family
MRCLHAAGNILGVAASMFLVGPHAQLKSMCEPARAVASLVYIITLALTLVVALALHAS